MTGQRRVTSLQVRLEIGARSAEGQTDAQIAAALQWSVWTVRKWRRQVQRTGRSGLAARPGRPATGALSHVKPVIRETLRTLREAHPGWGPQTLRLELSKALGCEGKTLPSRARIAAWLHEAQLTRGYQRHTTLEEPPAPRPTTPHEEWELDAQGVHRPGGRGRHADQCGRWVQPPQSGKLGLYRLSQTYDGGLSTRVSARLFALWPPATHQPGP